MNNKQYEKKLHAERLKGGLAGCALAVIAIALAVLLFGLWVALK